MTRAFGRPIPELFLVILTVLPMVWGTQCSHGMDRWDVSVSESPAITPHQHLNIVAVGDIMMGTAYPAHALPPEDGTGIFGGVLDELWDGDLTLGNLEGPLADDVLPVKCRGSRGGNCFEFVTPTRYADHLAGAGFNVMSIANNHILDCGIPGAERTIGVLRDIGVEPAGGTAIAQWEINGRFIAVLGFSYKASPFVFSMLDIPRSMEIVREVKASTDLVIVSFHGGAEGKSAAHIGGGNEIFLGENRGNVIKFARAVVDAGADLVIGHGPHVVRAMEIYKGKLIAYSLGNFLTYGMFNLKGPSGISVILKATLDGGTGNFIEGRLIPIKLENGGIPEIDHSADAIKLIRDLTETDIKHASIVIEDNGVLRPLKK